MAAPSSLPSGGHQLYYLVCCESLSHYLSSQSVFCLHYPNSQKISGNEVFNDMRLIFLFQILSFRWPHLKEIAGKLILFDLYAMNELKK